MNENIGILTIHGMGQQDATYANKFQINIYKNLKEHKENISFESSFWADLLDEKEKSFKIKIGHRSLSYQTMRDFALFHLGDVVAYQKSSSDNGKVYKKIHDRVRESFDKLLQKIGPDAKIIMLGHSLGSVIASDFIWDLSSAESPWFKNIKGLVTMGSPLALYSLAYDDIQPIKFFDTSSKWLNLYSKNDVLSNPVRPIYFGHSSSIEDLQVNVGGLLTCWNPLCHSKYFNDKTVAKIISKHLNRTFE